MNHAITLGNYEKAVIHELQDKRHLSPMVQRLKHKDRRLNLMGCFISECYDNNFTVSDCINKIFSDYLHDPECDLDRCAVLSNN